MVIWNDEGHRVTVPFVVCGSLSGVSGNDYSGLIPAAATAART